MEQIINRNFPALRHRDFFLFWSGQCISTIGTWMQTVGQSWLVYQITDSSLKLGIVSMLQFLPILLFSLPMGAIIDRLPKKKILFYVQFALMLLAFTLAALVWTGLARYWNIALLAFILGLLNCVDMPLRQSYMVHLASKEHLMNAIALNSTVFNAARIIGPSIAGLVFGYFGASACFLINGLSFIPVLINIRMIKAEGKSEQKGERKHLLKEIKEGIIYIIGNPAINTTIMMLAFTNIFITNFNILIPVMAKTVFQGDAKAYGFLMSGLGCGAFMGAFTTAASSYKGLSIKRLMGGFLFLSVFVLVLGFQGIFTLAFLVLACAGFCMTTAFSSANTTLQLNSPDDLRGRIMSVYSLVLGGAVPVGSLYSGSMCEVFKVSFTMKTSGVLGVLFMLGIIMLRYRKVYEYNMRRSETH